MRNAAASFDDDYAVDEPIRKAKPARKARGPGAKKKSAARDRKGGRSILHYAAIGLSASLAVGIMVNALVMQHSRHPAPLFGQAIALGDTPAPTVAPPPPAMAAATPVAPVAPPPAAMAPAPAPPAAHPHRAADVPPSPARAKGDDPIAKLLKASAGGEKTPDRAGAKESAKTVLAAQHALVKLGFVVKPTGSFGPATKSAIEAFERDQHLPVKGEMSRKVLKQISAESGLAID